MAAPTHIEQLEDEALPVPFGRYTLLSVLGEGGMARVFRARRDEPERDGEDVAVKIMRASVARNLDRLRRALIREVRVGTRMDHDNVVSTYEFGETDGQPWVAMALVDGLCLGELLRRAGPPPPQVVVEIARQICAGLQHAHELRLEDGRPANLVHRDLKPGNVMVGYDGIVKVVDFGLAKLTSLNDGTTAVGSVKGTAAYMSPEQVCARGLDRRSDLFSLGAILHELVTGGRLFTGDSLPALVLAIVSLDQTLPARLGPVEQAFPQLRPILEACLCVDPERRYPSASALERDLEALARTLPAQPTLRAWIDALPAQPSVEQANDSDRERPELDARPAPGPRAPAGSGPPDAPLAARRSPTPPRAPFDPHDTLNSNVCESPASPPGPTGASRQTRRARLTLSVLAAAALLGACALTLFLGLKSHPETAPPPDDGGRAEAIEVPETRDTRGAHEAPMRPDLAPDPARSETEIGDRTHEAAPTDEPETNPSPPG